MRRSTRAKRMLKTPLSAWRRGWKPRSGSRPLTGRVFSVLHNHNLIFFRPQNPDPQFWTSKFNHWLDPRENLDLDVISVIISSSDFFYERSWQETVFIHCFCVNIFLYITCLSQIKRNIYAFLNVNFFSILGFEMILSKILHQTAHLLRRQLWTKVLKAAQWLLLFYVLTWKLMSKNGVKDARFDKF